MLNIQSLKHFIIRNKKILFILMIITIVFIIITLLSLGIRINFLINEELNIVLTPLDSHLVVNHDQKENVTFTFINDNNLLCSSECIYKFTDLRNNTIIDHGNPKLSSKTKTVKSYQISPDTFGSGQAIYLFEVRCHNIKTLICKTKGEEYTKSSFLTLSYDLSVEEKAKVSIIEANLNDFLNKLRKVDVKNQWINTAYNLSSDVLTKISFRTKFDKNHKEIEDVNFRHTNMIRTSDTMIWQWASNNYPDIVNTLINATPEINMLVVDTDQVQIRLRNLISEYNELVYKFSGVFRDYPVIDFTEKEYGINSTIGNLSRSIDLRIINTLKQFSNPNQSNITSINKKIDSISIDLDLLKNTINYTNIEPNASSGIFNLSQIFLPPLNQTFSSRISIDIKLKDPVCCVFGKCKVCCTADSCKGDSSLYPVLFIHGHSFNKDVSPELSLNSFSKMQRKLQEEGIIDAGQLDLLNIESIPYGEYGRSGNPISIRASYYYTHYYDLGAYSLVTQKSERIENYALRLKDIIDTVKFITGSDKVNIVAHSMGGLVVRDYIRLFSGDSVNKLVLVAAPNKGISGTTKTLCSFLGSEKECEDMSEGSIFLKRLNQFKSPNNVDIYTISAIGCDTDGSQGDGIVKQQNTHLEGSTDFNISGQCTGLFKNNLHHDMINPDKYPSTYNIIKNILKSS